MKRDIVFRSKNKKTTKEVIPQMSQSEMKAAIEKGRKENAERKARIEEKTKNKVLNNFVENPACGFRSQASVILSQKNLSLPPKVMDSIVERELKNCSR